MTISHLFDLRAVLAADKLANVLTRIIDTLVESQLVRISSPNFSFLLRVGHCPQNDFAVRRGSNRRLVSSFKDGIGTSLGNRGKRCGYFCGTDNFAVGPKCGSKRKLPDEVNH